MAQESQTPFSMTPEEQERLTKLDKVRSQASLNYGAYWLPELPETAAQEVYERLLDAERRLASPTLLEADYVDGVATYDDEVGFVEGDGKTLISTEHATVQRLPYRAGNPKKEHEPGIAALGALLHEDTGAGHVTMLGRQTNNANRAIDHPLKHRITHEITSGNDRELFLSLHGMSSGHVSDLEDVRPYNVSIGIGNTPNDATRERAEKMQALAGDLDLRAGINAPFILLDSRDPIQPKLRDDGTLRTTTFKATANKLGVTTRQHAEDIGGPDLAALQVEYSGFLRLTSPENDRDYKSRYMGAYIGYLLLRQTVEIGL